MRQNMKNVMIIDGAINCAYDLFQATDEEFKILFPDDGQDISFIEELPDNHGVVSCLKKL